MPCLADHLAVAGRRREDVEAGCARRGRDDVVEVGGLCRPRNYSERGCFFPDFWLNGV